MCDLLSLNKKIYITYIKDHTHIYVWSFIFKYIIYITYMCDVRQLCNLHSLSQWQAAEPEYPAEALKKRKALLKNVVSDFLFIFNMQYFSNKQAKVEYPAEKTSRPKFSILWRCRLAFLCKILLGCCAQKGAKIETLFMSGFELGGELNIII